MYTDDLVDLIHALRSEMENVAERADNETDGATQHKAYKLVDEVRLKCDELDDLVNVFVS